MENQTATNEQPIENQETKKKKRGISYYLKITAIVLLSIFLIVVVALFYIFNRLSKDGNLEKIVNAQLSSATKTQIKFEKIEISFPTFILKNITIATDTPVLTLNSHISEAILRPSFSAALRGKLLIDYIGVSSSTTNLTVKQHAQPVEKASNTKDTANTVQTSTTPTQANQKSKAEPDSTFQPPFNSIQLSSIHLNFKDIPYNEAFDISLNKFGISTSLLSSSLPIEIDLIVKEIATIKTNGSLDLPNAINTDIDLAIINFEKIKKYIPKDYTGYLQQFTGANLTANIKYNLKNNSIDVNNTNISINPGIKANGKATFSSLSPLEGNAEINLEPVSIQTINPFVAPYLPKEYKISLKNGAIKANSQIQISKTNSPDIKAEIIPSNIEVTTSMIPYSIKLPTANINYDGSSATIKSLKLNAGSQNIDIPEFKYTISNGNMSGTVNANAKFDEIMKIAASYTGDLAKNLKLNGSAKANIKVSGSTSKPVITADCDINETTVEYSSIPEKILLSNAKINYNNDIVKVNNANVLFAKQKVIIPEFSYTIPSNALKGSLKADSIIVKEIWKAIKPMLGESVKDMEIDGNIIANASVDGNISKPIINANASLSKGNVKSSLLPEAIEITKGNISYNGASAIAKDFEVKTAGQTINMSEFSYDIAKGGLKGNAKGNADIESLWNILKPIIGTAAADITIKGKADLSVQISGNTTKPIINGTANLLNASFSHPSVLRTVEQINGPVEFDLNGINCKNISAFWGKSKAIVNGTLKDYSKLISDFKFTVQPLDITDAAGFFLKDSGYSVEGTGSGKGTITGELEKIKVKCEATAPSGKVAIALMEGSDSFKFPYTNLKTLCEYYNSVFTISTATLNIFSGDIRADGKVFLDKDPIEFAINTNLNMIQIQDFLKENLTKYQDSLTGPIKGSFRATGTTLGLESLKGNADLTAPGGTYKCPDAMKKIVSQLKQTKFAEKINEQTLASGTYKNLIGNYRIEAGKVISDNALANFEQGNISFSGSVGLDASISGNSRLTLTREACLKDDLLAKLIGNNQNLVVPIAIKGSLTSPSVEPKLDDLTKQVIKDQKDELINKGLKSLEKRLGINLGNNQPATNAATVATTTTSTPSNTTQSNIAPSTTSKEPDNTNKKEDDVKSKLKQAEKDLKKSLKKLFK